MSTFSLRIIAMVTMLIDHVAMFFLDNPVFLRAIGRIAFITYCYLLVDGYMHVRNDAKRVGKHLLRLIVLAVVSEAAFDLALYGTFSMKKQSVIIPLLFGYIGMIFSDAFSEKKGGRVFVAVYIIIVSAMTYFAATDYPIIGVLLIFAFFEYAKRKEDFAVEKRFTVLFIILGVYAIMYDWFLIGPCDVSEYISKASTLLPYNVVIVGTDLPLSLYNGKLGYDKKWFSILYEWFYPVHLFIIFGYPKF